MIEVNGKVISILFENDKRNYTIFKIDTDDQNGKITVTASTFAPMLGEQLVVKGSWVTHARYGRQMCAAEWYPNESFVDENFELFLVTRIPGIGSKLAKRIVAKFGNSIYDILLNAPDKLAKVRGVSLGKAKEMGEIFAEYNEIQILKRFLEEHGIAGGHAPVIATYYGSGAIELINDNPFRLCEDFEEINFAMADRIAMNMGLEAGSAVRMRAGISYALLHSAREGHCCLPREQVVKIAAKNLGIGGDEIEDEIAAMLRDGELIEDEDDCQQILFLTSMYYLETSIAQRLISLINEAPKFTAQEINNLARIAEQLSRVTLAPCQRQALEAVLKDGVVVITGGPGTGKTTVVRCIKELFEHCGLQVVLAAPTGRAARRLGDASKSSAVTLHRLLEAQGDKTTERFLKNSDNPLDGEIFIVDELSMADTELFFNLLTALPEGARLILVGDSDQLPSVGAGMVLRDIIRSRAIPVVNFNEVFRQCQGSSIVLNSHRIRSGAVPDLVGNDEFTFVETRDIQETARLIIEEYVALMASGLDHINDLQVLSPMYRAECGVNKLNTTIQQAVNANGQKIIVNAADSGFRVGDKVMQTRNNYEKGIYNGDIGIVELGGDNGLIVNFYGNMILIEAESIADINLAYAVTVHKSQGSEYKVVLLALAKEHAPLLSRAVLYTAVTRAKEQLKIFGNISALRTATNNMRNVRRWTGLESKLRRLGENFE